MKDIADLVARIFIAFLFFYEAVDSILFFDDTLETMSAYGINWNQEILLSIMIGFLIIGATSVLIGYYANIGAFFLLIYWAIFTFTVYSFWNDPVELRRVNVLMFMRNLALCGGIMILMLNGSGKYSVRRLLHNLRLPG